MSLKGKIKDIADSLRETLGTNVKYTLSQMPPLIRSLNFKYKTDDIYYNFFKFDCSKYGDALIFNSHMNITAYTENTENRYKKQNLITYRGYNSHYYYDKDVEFSDSLHTIFPVNPDVYDYQYGDTYYDFSSNTFEYEYYPTFHFCNYNKTTEPFDKIVLSQHFLINFEDSEKTYSVGLGITSNSPYYDSSWYGKTDTSYSGCCSKFFWLSVEASKLYVTSGIKNKNAETFKDYICDLEPNTDLDISVEVNYTDEDLTNNNFSNIFNYKITVNSTEYTGTLEHTWTDSFLQGNLRYNNRPFGIATLKDTPEKLWWYSMEMKGRRFTNVLINPIVSFAEGRLFEITDENSPGLKNIHAKCINLCTNPAFKTLDNSSVEIIEPYAFQAENTSDYTFFMQLEKINLPACKTIDSFAFGGLSSRWSTIAELNIPNVEKIGTCAFQYSLRKMHGTLALNKVTSIGSSAFAQAGFSKISLPLITTLGGSTFENCQNLEEIDMPLLETISGNYCFQSCNALRKIRMPNLKTTGYYSFAYKRCHYTTEDFYFPNLETLDSGAFAYSNFGPRGKINFLPNVKTIGFSAFRACVCEEIELPELLNSDGQSSFYNIKNLKKLRLPKVNGKFGYFFRNITYKSDDYTFDLDLIAPNLSYYCYSMLDSVFFAIFKSSYLTIPDNPYYGVFNNSWITQAYIKNLNYINDRFFYQAYNLEIAYFDSAYTIGKTSSYAEHFRQCLNLKALILAGDETVCSLIDKNAFYQTPIAPLANQPVANNIKQKREGYIYVPRALLESYKTTTNWSFYADSFRAIEDYGGLEGIKKLIHPDYANSVNLTNSQLVSDIQNPLRSKVLSTELDVTISNTINNVDCSVFGDNNQYVVMNRGSRSISSRNLVLLSLPAVKDFEVEFDMVESSTNNVTLWFGFKKIPETVEEFTNENVCQPYTHGVHFRAGFYKTAKVDGAGTSLSRSGYVENYYCRTPELDQLYSDYKGFYYYEKIHIRIVRQGRVFKKYMNEILTAQAECDEIQHCPGGFLGIELHNSNTVGITNFVLKYDNTWHDPLSNEIWISSVRLPNLTVNIDGVDEVLSKNEFGYYVFDTTNVTDLMDVKMFSDNTQISDLSTKITQFSGKILCITDNEQVTYN